MPGHNSVLFILGVFLLWFGFYGFNPGTMAIVIVPADGSGFMNVVSRCVVSTTMGETALASLCLSPAGSHCCSKYRVRHACCCGCHLAVPDMSLIARTQLHWHSERCVQLCV